MARFILLKHDNATFNKCLAAINKVASEAGEPWIDSFNKESEKAGTLANMEVLLHYYKLFEDTDVKWERVLVHTQRPEWEYQNYNGIDICIGEDRNGRSIVYKSIGLPENIKEMLEGLDNVRLHEAIDMYVKGKVIDSEGIELRISEYKNN